MMNELYTLEEQTDLLTALPKVIGRYGACLDEMFWTPLRDIQVFAPKAFSHFSGAAHPAVSGLLVAGSLVANLGYIAKVFNKNKAESLSEVMENCREELGDKYCYLDFDGLLSDENKAELEKYFQEDLNNKNYGYLEVEIDNPKGDYQLRYRLSKKFKAILGSSATYTEIINGLNLNDKQDAAIKAQLDKMIPEPDRDKPISELRKDFFEKAKKITAGDAGKVAFDFADSAAFQFWLVFFISDMLYGNPDTNTWNWRTQIITLGLAVGISIVQFGAKLLDLVRRRKKEREQDKKLSTEKTNAAVVNESLQHKQHTSFFIRMLQQHNKDKASRSSLPADIVIAETFIDKVELIEKSLAKRFRNRFFSITKSTTEIEEIITGETKDKASFVQAGTALRTTANVAIIGSFLEWVSGVALSTLSRVKSIINFFNGTGGGILGVVALGIGGIFGVVYYNKSIKPGLETQKKQLKEQYNQNKFKFDFLQDLETENRKLKKLAKANGLEKLPVMKGSDDRAFRRLVPSQKTSLGTYAKKLVNRGGVIVGRIGTGILLFRLSALAILGLAGISLAATVTAVLWPVTVAALVIGAVWAGIFLYQYIQERRIASAKNFMNDIDNRIEAEQVANDTYRKQLGLEINPDRYNETIKKQNLDLGYENEEENFSDTESSEETTQKTITAGKKDLPIGEIAKLPTVQPKRLKFWEEPKSIQRSTGMEMQYDVPPGLVR